MIEIKKTGDPLEESFRLGWESAIALYDLIKHQSEQSAIDAMRDTSYRLYFEALHELVNQPNYDNYPCRDCSDSTRESCCGCTAYYRWQKENGGK